MTTTDFRQFIDALVSAKCCAFIPDDDAKLAARAALTATVTAFSRKGASSSITAMEAVELHESRYGYRG